MEFDVGIRSCRCPRSSVTVRKNRKQHQSLRRRTGSRLDQTHTRLAHVRQRDDEGLGYRCPPGQRERRERVCTDSEQSRSRNVVHSTEAIRVSRRVCHILFSNNLSVLHYNFTLYLFRHPIQDSRSGSFLSNLEQIVNEKNPSLILCVIQSARGDIYSSIKRKLCIDRAGS